MEKIKTENLFTDMYEMREHLYQEDKNTAILSVRNEVEEAILHHVTPPHLRYLLFKLTNYCNSDCIYCSHAVGRARYEKKHMIPHDIVMRTIEEAAGLGVQAITISGGEPLLRNDIESIIRRVTELKMVPVLLTNGLLLDQYWDILGAAGLRYIVISMDSADKEIYEKQRGADFNRALAGIRAAMKLRDKYGNVEIHVSAVLTRNNYDDFMSFVFFTQERNIKVQVIPYHKREHDEDDLSLVEASRIKQIADQLQAIKNKNGLIANSAGFLRHIPDYFIKGKVLPDHFTCKVGFTNLCIDAYMDIKPCWSARFAPLGNLREKSLTEIWNSEILAEYRDRMLRCECEGCWYLCTSEVCLMLDE